jgi:hypothetical protein
VCVASIGEDNLVGGDKHKWSLRPTGVNIFSRYALYWSFMKDVRLTPRLGMKSGTGPLNLIRVVSSSPLLRFSSAKAGMRCEL